MVKNFRRLLACGLLAVSAITTGLGQSATTTTTTRSKLPVHALRSISATDTNFSDLEFLVQEIGSARVVMLGEPTHGEGNVTEAKIRLLRFLKERMGFTTVAFESGFYELDRAQRDINAGVAVPEALENSVFPIWTSTQEFQGILPLLGKGGLRVAGFDGQLGGDYRDELVEELQEFLRPEKGANAIGYDYLEEVVAALGHFVVPQNFQPALFESQLAKASKLLQKIAAGPDTPRRTRAAFWLQNLRSMQAMARSYAANDLSIKSEAEFKAADNNPRDAQMADNLLWYLGQYPQEKVVCWGALPHLANKLEVLNNEEIQIFRPMGRAVQAALRPHDVYVLGTLAGGGTYQRVGELRTVPVPQAGSLEAELLGQGSEYAFVSLKHDAPKVTLITSAIDYTPLAGPWSEVVDGFLFLKSVHPPHQGEGSAEPAPAVAAVTGASSQVPLGQLNPAIQRKGSASTVGTLARVQGTVLDRKTGAVVPFATVAVPGRATGTVANAQGHFELTAGRAEILQITSVGYQTANVPATATAGSLIIRLVPAAYALADVRVSAQSQNPAKIMKKVIKAIPQNYRFADDATEVYTHRRISNFDTVQYEIEYLADAFVPAGFRSYHSIMGPSPKIRVHNAHVLRGRQEPVLQDALFGGVGGSVHSSDPVRVSPLFQARALSKYSLRFDTILQSGAVTTYVISFKAKKANSRTTGLYLASGYEGRLFINTDTYAVTQYEALWQEDTIHHNMVAHKYHGSQLGRAGAIANLYSSVYSDWRSAHAVQYERAADGRYQVAVSQMQAIMIGRHLKKGPFHYQIATTIYPHAARLTTVAELSPKDAKFEWEPSQLPKAPSDAALWQTYQRPMPPAAATPSLESRQP